MTSFFFFPSFYSPHLPPLPVGWRFNEMKAVVVAPTQKSELVEKKERFSESALLFAMVGFLSARWLLVLCVTLLLFASGGNGFWRRKMNRRDRYWHQRAVNILLSRRRNKNTAVEFIAAFREAAGERPRQKPRRPLAWPWIMVRLAWQQQRRRRISDYVAATQQRLRRNLMDMEKRRVERAVGAPLVQGVFQFLDHTY